MIICALREEEQLLIGDQTLTLKSVGRPGLVTVMLGSGETVPLIWDRTLELFPGVKIGVAKAGSQGDRAKLLIDAPRDVLVKRVRPDAAT